MANPIDTLKGTLSRVGSYTSLTDAQIQAAAEKQIGDLYAQRVQNTQNTATATNAAYEAQLEALMARYDRNEARSKEGYTAATARIADQVRGHGMQRGSYNNALTDYMGRLSDEASSQIAGERELQAGGVKDQQKLLEDQLAQQLQQLEAGKKADTAAYIDTLGAREYDRGVTASKTANSLAESLYKYEHQLETEAEDKRQWEAEMQFKWDKMNASGSGSGGKRRSAGSGPDNDKNSGSDFNTFMVQMGRNQDVGTAFKAYQFQKNPVNRRAGAELLKRVGR